MTVIKFNWLQTNIINKKLQNFNLFMIITISDENVLIDFWFFLTVSQFHTEVLVTFYWFLLTLLKLFAEKNIFIKKLDPFGYDYHNFGQRIWLVFWFALYLFSFNLCTMSFYFTLLSFPTYNRWCIGRLARS